MTTADWKTVRVFISSTFQDMQAERDYLVRFVFPRLREKLVRRRIHFVEVDLRWGITSDQDVLGVCREIIDECRPRFLCLLGGRYGWIPPGGEISITHEEIQYAVLNRLEENGFHYFYFREPAVTDAMDKTAPGVYREPTGSVADQGLTALKNAITATGIGSRIYTARWDPQQQYLIGLEAFGNKVYSDLLAGINDQFRSETPIPLDEFAREKAAMDAFIAERVEGYVAGSRESILKELTDFIQESGSPNIFLLTGSSGSGKSALLAKFLERQLRSQSQGVETPLVIYHFIAVSPGSTDFRQTMRRLCRELSTALEMQDELPTDLYQLIAKFQALIVQAASSRQVVLLMDGLNHLDTADNPQMMHWLPNELPPTLRLIFSGAVSSESDPAAEYCPELDALRTRGTHMREVSLNPLLPADVLAITRVYLTRYQKSLTNDQEEALLEKPEIGNPLFLRVMLEELRTLGLYEEIYERISEMPGTIQAMFQWIFQVRLSQDPAFRDDEGRLIGVQLVRKVVSLLWVSRYGLSHAELVALVDPGDTRGNVSALLRLLRSYLMHSGELINFYHDQFRKGVKHEYLNSESKRMAAHRALAIYFFRQSDPKGDGSWKGENPRAFKELPHHFFEAKLYDRLFAIASDNHFLSVQERAFPDDIRLPLETLQKAIRAAVNAEDAGKMAGISMRHANQLLTLRRESALNALAEGDLKRAWNMADCAAADSAALWYLLIAWKLKESGRHDEVRETVKKLADKKFAPLAAGWMQKIAAKALCELADLADEHFIDASSNLIMEKGALFCEMLFNKGFETLALQTVHRIKNPFIQDEALASVANACGKSGDVVRALMITEKIKGVRSRSRALCYIATAQAETGNNSGAEKTFVEALKDTDKIDGPDSRAEVFQMVATARATAGYTLESQRTFDRALDIAREIKYNNEKHDTIIREISTARASAGDFDGAFASAAFIYRFEIKVDVYCAIAVEQAKAADLDNARKTAEKIPYEGVLSWAYANIAAAQARLGDISGALESEHRYISRPESRDDALNAIATAQAIARDVPEALKTAHRIQNLRKRMKTFCAIVTAQFEAGDTDLALTVAEGIEGAWESGNAIYAVAAAQARAGNQKDALKTFARAMTVAGRIERDWTQDDTLRNILKNQTLGGDIVKTLKKAVKNCDPDIRTDFILAISNLRIQGEGLDDVRRQFAQTLTAAAQLNSFSRAEALCTIANVQSDVGNQRGAQRTLTRAYTAAKRIDDRWQRDRMIQAIITAQLRTGAISQALRDAQSIEDARPHVHTLCDIATAQIQARDNDSAKRTFAQALAVGQSITSGSAGYKEALQAVASIPVKAKWTNQVLIEIIEGIDDQSYREEILQGIVTAMAKTGKVDRSVSIAENFKNARNRIQTLCDIASVQARLEDHEGAQQTFSRAMMTANRNREDDILTSITIAQARAGDLVNALATAKKIRFDRTRDYAFSTVATEYAQRGDLVKAESIVEEINHEPRDESLCVIAKTHAQTGDLMRALKIAKTIKMNWELVEAMCAVAAEHVRVGDENQALNIALRLEDASQRDEVLNTIASVQAQMGNLVRAMATVDRIQWSWRGRKSLRAISRAHARSGDVSQALKVAEMIEDAWERDNALLDIVTELAQAGLFAEAIQALSYFLESEKASVIPVAKIIAASGNKNAISSLLILCANNQSTTYQMCGVLAELYPDQSASIAHAIL